MIQPTELLEHLGVMRVVLDDALVRVLRTDMVLLLLVDMANLEPDVCMCEWRRRVSEDAVKALERLLIFSLLFVYDAKAEEDFICLIEV